MIDLMRRGAVGASSTFVVILFVSAIVAGFLGYGAFEGVANDEDLEETHLSSHAGPKERGTGNPPSFLAEPLDPTYVSYGDLTILTAFVVDIDNDVLTVTWDWGDGTFDVTTTAPAAVPTQIQNSHLYLPTAQQGRGDYIEYATVTLSLDDGNENNISCDTTVDIFMPWNDPPTILNLSVPDTTVDPIDEITITAAARDLEGEPLTWVFQFNDSVQVYREVVVNTGASAPNETVWLNITHVFGTEGTHEVTLNVSDALPPYQIWPHNVSSTVRVMAINNSVPIVTSVIGVFPSSPVVYYPPGYVTVAFAISAVDFDGDVLNASWDFGDDSPPGLNVSSGGPWVYDFIQTHSYSDQGWYNVSVVVTDGRVDHEVLRYELVWVSSTNLPPVVRSLETSGPHMPVFIVGDNLSFMIVLSDVEEDSLSVIWDFGDGSPEVYMNLTEYSDGNTTSTVQHVYASQGSYTVTVNFTDNKEGLLEHNLSYTYGLDVWVDDTGPIADAGEDADAFIGIMFTFDGSGSSDDIEIVNYTWTFTYNGSQEVLYGPAPSFIFWSEGTYEVTLNVTDIGGNSAEDTVLITLYTEIPEFQHVIFPTISTLTAIALLLAIRKRR